MQSSLSTTILGILTIIGDVGAFIAHFMQENPAPITVEGWFGYGMGLATGVGLIFAKAYNVSHSGTNAEPHVVPKI